jgi:Domain of unknown function (DUF3883)
MNSAKFTSSAKSEAGQNSQIMSSAEWLSWLNEMRAETSAGYMLKPDWMLGHYRGERSAARDYADRELLELVQNAADAATEAGEPGRIRIEVTRHGICVANSGMPFNKSGVRSLMTAHTSDKADRQENLIGAKGLGFRALLNWTAEPYISSGELEIGFNQEHSIKTAREISTQSHKLAQLIESHSPVPAPILPFPAFGDALSELNDEAIVALMTRARQLRVAGFDTVVVAAFDKPASFDAAVAQVREFQPDFLLFVDAIEEITFRIEDKAETRWKRLEGDNNAVDIEIDTGGVITRKQWFCLSRKGSIPDPENEACDRGYELAIAITRNKTSFTPKLHCYFPTDVGVPLPALFHATLELDSNRKSLNAGSKLNAAVLAQLALFYVDVLAKLTASKSIPDPLFYLGRSGNFPEPLRHFADAIRKAASTRRLIAARNGKRVTAAETFVGPLDYTNWLPYKLFGSLAKCATQNDRLTLEWLGVEQLDLSEMVSTLKRAELSIDERARAIVGIAKHVPSQYHDRSLLIDTSGKPLGRRNVAFPPPASGKPPILPKWAKAKFVDHELWNRIGQLMPGSARQRFDQLQHFNVSELNASGLIGSLRKQANDTIRARPADRETILQEYLAALLKLRKGLAKEGQFPGALPLVCCADSEWRPASRVHLAAAYGHTGKITSALYSHSLKNLVGMPDQNGLDASDETLGDFMLWIGVNRWPLRLTEELPLRLRPLVYDALPEEFVVAEDRYQQQLKRSDLVWGSTLHAEYETLAGLSGILSSAPSAAILAWLSLDPRFDSTAPVKFLTKLRAKGPTASFRPYNGPLPDIVRYELATQPWLMSTKGIRVAPSECLATPGRLADLFAQPAAVGADEEQALGINPATSARGLIHANVAKSLSQFSSAQIYSLLLSLPDKQVSSDVVRSLYVQLLDLEDFDPASAEKLAAKFKREGFVQAKRRGALEWVPVGEALYLDRDNFPVVVRSKFSLIDLPPRRSRVLVEMLFGVLPTSKQKFSMNVTRIVEENGLITAKLKHRLDESLPYIKVFRLAVSNDVSRVSRLDNVELKIAKRVDLDFTMGDNLYPGTLDSGRHMLNDNELIVAIDLAQSEAEIMAHATTAMADGLAEFFELQSGDDFERLLLADEQAVRLIQLRRLLANHDAEEVDKLLATVDEQLLPKIEPSNVDAATLAAGLAVAAAASVLAESFQATTGFATNSQTSSNASEGFQNIADVAQTIPPPPLLPPPPRPKTVAVAVTVLDVHEPELDSSGKKIGLRVSGGGGGGANYGNVDNFAPQDAEQWAMFFEREQQRFPLLVAAIQGKDAFGCDCLSFDSEDDINAFKAEPSRTELVSRFIEVKSGAVRLTENEVIAAKARGERYFIYRLLFVHRGRTSARLTIVKNPLRHKAALKRECEISIEAISDRVEIQLDGQTS